MQHGTTPTNTNANTAGTANSADGFQSASTTNSQPKRPFGHSFSFGSSSLPFVIPEPKPFASFSTTKFSRSEPGKISKDELPGEFYVQFGEQDCGHVIWHESIMKVQISTANSFNFELINVQLQERIMQDAIFSCADGGCYLSSFNQQYPVMRVLDKYLENKLEKYVKIVKPDPHVTQSDDEILVPVTQPTIMPPQIKRPDNVKMEEDDDVDMGPVIKSINHRSYSTVRRRGGRKRCPTRKFIVQPTIEMLQKTIKKLRAENSDLRDENYDLGNDLQNNEDTMIHEDEVRKIKKKHKHEVKRLKDHIEELQSEIYEAA